MPYGVFETTGRVLSSYTVLTSLSWLTYPTHFLGAYNGSYNMGDKYAGYKE